MQRDVHDHVDVVQMHARGCRLEREPEGLGRLLLMFLLQWHKTSFQLAPSVIKCSSACTALTGADGLELDDLLAYVTDTYRMPASLCRRMHTCRVWQEECCRP